MGQFSKNYRTFIQKIVTKLSKIWGWDPVIGKNLSRNSQTMGQKGPDPGSGSATLFQCTGTLLVTDGEFSEWFLTLPTLQVVALHIGKSSNWRKGEDEESVLIPGRTVSWPRAAHMPRDLNSDLVTWTTRGLLWSRTAAFIASQLTELNLLVCKQPPRLKL